MRYIALIILALALPGVMTSIAHAQGAGIEWDILNREVVELYNAGKYDRAVVVAPEALKIAKQNVGPRPSRCGDSPGESCGFVSYHHAK